MTSRLAVLVLAGGFLVACGGEKDEKERAEAAKPCGPAPAALASDPTLAPGFPSPSELTYTGEEQAGPSRIVHGYWDGNIDEAFDGYKDAFDGTDYSVTKEEQEEVDAEVNFAGGDVSGQVKLVQTCEDRTDVSITIRPS